MHRAIRDDELPLKRMPADHPPPEGELPFGPHNLSMYRLNFGSRVLLAGSHLGYRFAAKDAGRRVLHLDWDVSATLLRVDARGRVSATVGRITRRLAAVEDLDLLQFSFPARTGLFRIDISFKTFGGRKLGSYTEHFRVVPRRVKLRVAVSAPAFAPGAVAYARVLNLGSVPAELRPGLAVERAVGDEWLRQQLPPVPQRSIERFRWTLSGGEASPCVAFPIPTDAPVGAYRFSSSALVFGKFKRRTLTAPFRVGPG